MSPATVLVNGRNAIYAPKPEAFIIFEQNFALVYIWLDQHLFTIHKGKVSYDQYISISALSVYALAQCTGKLWMFVSEAEAAPADCGSDARNSLRYRCVFALGAYS